MSWMAEFFLIFFSPIGSIFAFNCFALWAWDGACASCALGVGLRRFVVNLPLNINCKLAQTQAAYALFASLPTLSMDLNFSSIGANCLSS
jgi:hypothetical protein